MPRSSNHRMRRKEMGKKGEAMDGGTEVVRDREKNHGIVDTGVVMEREKNLTSRFWQ